MVIHECGAEVTALTWITWTECKSQVFMTPLEYTDVPCTVSDKISNSKSFSYLGKMTGLARGKNGKNVWLLSNCRFLTVYECIQRRPYFFDVLILLVSLNYISVFTITDIA